MKRFKDQRGGRVTSLHRMREAYLVVYLLSGFFCSPSKPTFLSSVSARLLGTEPLLTSDLAFSPGFFCSPSKPTFLSSVSARLLGTGPLLTSDLVFSSGVFCSPSKPTFLSCSAA